MDTYLGRKITWEVAFNKRTDDFGNYYDACEFLTNCRYSYGSLCGNMPVALVKGRYNLPQKWKNLSALDKKNIDGVMMGNLIGSFRNGVVKIYFFDESPITK